MLKLFKHINRRFSTLLIADPNSQSQELQSLLTAGTKFNEPIDILHLNKDAQSFKTFYHKYGNSEIRKILLSQNPDFDGKSYETSSYFINAFLAKNSYNRVIMTNSIIAKELLPRLAVIYDSQGITDVIDIIDKETFIRPIYAGNALAKIRYTSRPLFMSIRVTNFEKLKPDSKKPATIEEINSEDYLGGFKKRVIVKENIIQKSERPELTSARIVISGGRALKSKENFELLYKLADKLEGSNVGASRAAVDAGYVSNDLQIGQTGKIVAPDIYFAFGISGAIQHVAGIQDSKIIVAINKNKEEPIFQIADYGLVGDIFTIIPELTEKL